MFSFLLRLMWYEYGSQTTIRKLYTKHPWTVEFMVSALSLISFISIIVTHIIQYASIVLLAFLVVFCR